MRDVAEPRGPRGQRVRSRRVARPGTSEAAWVSHYFFLVELARATGLLSCRRVDGLRSVVKLPEEAHISELDAVLRVASADFVSRNPRCGRVVQPQGNPARASAGPRATCLFKQPWDLGPRRVPSAGQGPQRRRGLEPATIAIAGCRGTLRESIKIYALYSTPKTIRPVSSGIYTQMAYIFRAGCLFEGATRINTQRENAGPARAFHRGEYRETGAQFIVRLFGPFPLTQGHFAPTAPTLSTPGPPTGPASTSALRPAAQLAPRPDFVVAVYEVRSTA